MAVYIDDVGPSFYILMTTEAEGEQEVIEGTKRARDNELIEDTKPKRARRQPRL